MVGLKAHAAFKPTTWLIINKVISLALYSPSRGTDCTRKLKNVSVTFTVQSFICVVNVCLKGTCYFSVVSGFVSLPAFFVSTCVFVVSLCQNVTGIDSLDLPVFSSYCFKNRTTFWSCPLCSQSSPALSRSLSLPLSLTLSRSRSLSLGLQCQSDLLAH